MNSLSGGWAAAGSALVPPRRCPRRSHSRRSRFGLTSASPLPRPLRSWPAWAVWGRGSDAARAHIGATAGGWRPAADSATESPATKTAVAIWRYGGSRPSGWWPTAEVRWPSAGSCARQTCDFPRVSDSWDCRAGVVFPCQLARQSDLLRSLVDRVRGTRCSRGLPKIRRINPDCRPYCFMNTLKTGHDR